MLTKGLHHLGLTINSLTEAKLFFIELLGWQLVKEESHYPAAFVSDGTILITLWKVKKYPATAFSRQENIGLHHFAINTNQQEFHTIYQKLTCSQFTIEFGPQLLRSGPAQHFIVNGPSNIRIEFINFPKQEY